MTSLDIETIENAGRPAMVWVPEPQEGAPKWEALPLVVDALALLATVGLLITLLVQQKTLRRFEP